MQHKVGEHLSVRPLLKSYSSNSVEKITMRDPTARTIPPGYGYLEYAAERDSNAVISGWMLDLSGPFDRLDIRCDDHEPVKADVVIRKDLAAACPRIPRAELGGFLARVPVAWAGSDGVLEARLVGLRGGCPGAKMDIGLHRWKTRPLPPGDVIRRAAGNENHHFYVTTGVKNCNDFLRAVQAHADLGSVRELLDWGSGAGRVTRHLVDRLPHARVHGTDIDVEAVEWAAANIDGGTFVPCRQDPPLPYRDERFDVVVNLSVFTHLLERYQHLWLAELRRIIKPGGLMIATTQGPHAGRWLFTDPKMFARLFENGFSDFIPDVELGHVASSDYYRATFQTREWTERTFGLYFRVLDYWEGGMNNLQDLYVMQKC